MLGIVSLFCCQVNSIIVLFFFGKCCTFYDFLLDFLFDHPFFNFLVIILNHFVLNFRIILLEKHDKSKNNYSQLKLISSNFTKLIKNKYSEIYFNNYNKLCTNSLLVPLEWFGTKWKNIQYNSGESIFITWHMTFFWIDYNIYLANT